MFMKISKQRFYELGLGVEKECCICCPDCQEKDGVLFCGDMNIEDAEKNLEIAPCLDDERIRMEMTENEYDAYRHNRLTVEKGRVE